ncbi:zinc finger protein CONSTANS-LIKE 4-like [Macadamia integrifolia]|uniref:zinc finger protein CONSTANS-LIKE 4-like n=1 Tax=Macadamia integrifolia TaxID=60698 RepID=UPI001C4E940D|nr:zinc finger protein CONSTANS-LIKE 4-like [Macadamia integrifolia]
MCDVCEQAPASFACKADAAALCVTCDRDIHSANPLARRHERSPVVPFYKPATATAAAVVKSKAINLLVPVKSNGDDCDDDDLKDADGDGEETEAASWLLPNPNQISSSKLRI